MSNEYKKEQTLLKFSTASCLAFAVFGIGLGLWNGSMIIVFDGAYSLISLGLTVIALAATMYIHPKDKKRAKSLTPEKIQYIESSVVLLKGLVVTLLCLVSLSSAVRAIFHGGTEVDASSALLFAVINVIGCLITYIALNKNAGKKPSTILKAESNQWFMDTVISAAVLVGFLATALLMTTDLAEYAVYADPLMMLIASIYFISIPLKMVTDSCKKIIQLRGCKDKFCNSHYG